MLRRNCFGVVGPTRARLGSHAEPPAPWPLLGVWQEFTTKWAIGALTSVMTAFRGSRLWSFGDMSGIIGS
jgi:hypothetical protein